MTGNATEERDRHESRVTNIPNRVLIVGLGQTGIAMARLLASLDKSITIVDAKREEDLGDALKQLKDIPFTGRFGGHSPEDFLSHPLIVLSPGVDSEMPILEEARAKGIRITGEMEIASTFVKEPIIAITGTNGKTTVTSLLGEIFRKAFGSVFVGGNIGNPLANYVLEGSRAPYVILEVSSFQLETVESFRPNTAMLLNIAEDHLDRYRNFDEYKRAKLRIFENQQAEDYAVLNRSLPALEGLKSKPLFFTASGDEIEAGGFVRDGIMHIRVRGIEYRYDRRISPLPGVHNTENLLAALIVCHIYGIDQGTVTEAVKSFAGLSHRLEFVREREGVRYYNDSKATNVDATKRALEGMTAPVVLIAGGRDKGGSYEVMRDLMGRVKAMVLIGEAKERIGKEIGGYTKTLTAHDLDVAVKEASKIAANGDVVLFSPMCSSYDMFRDYKERGETFKRLVESL